MNRNGGKACTLQIATHNVNGARSRSGSCRLQGMVKLWCQLGLAVVCLQETRLTNASCGEYENVINDTARHLIHPGWKAFWSHYTGSSAGVGILVRRDMLGSGSIKVRKNTAGKADAEVILRGRVMSLALDWGGHRLNVGCIYMPSGCATAQRQVISHHLGPWAGRPRLHVWGGDFNFVQNVELDRCQTQLVGIPGLEDEIAPPPLAASAEPSRVSVRLQQAGRAARVEVPVEAGGVHQPEGTGRQARVAHRHHDVGTAELFNAACPDLEDVFRLLHPNKRQYSYIHSRWASRIDRFMTSSALRPFVTATGALANSMTDHRPVGLTLLATSSAQASGPGLKRMRMHFASDVVLKEVMRVWLEEQLGARPVVVSTDHDALQAQLLEWWDAFKGRLMGKVAALNRMAKAYRLQHSGPEVAAARVGLQAAVGEVERGTWNAANLKAVITARAELARVEAADRIDTKFQCRREWVLGQERPSPLLSRLTQPPATARVVVALRDASGRLEDRPYHMSCIVARFWAATSGAVHTSRVAQDQVLAPLRADSQRCIGVEAAAKLGETIITRGEVKSALGRAATGKSPGPDGVTYDIYKEYSLLFIPVLSEVFTAIGVSGAVRDGFLDGVISILPKKGDLTLPANYRPITLLNADYRLLAKVLAARLGGALRGVVSVEQTAFLKGRHIGENIMLLQLLPQLMKLKGESAVIAFCDFAKAYDTIDRDFLYRAMDAMGAGAGFIRWAKIMLSCTRACAVVNGHVSEKQVFAAGVRQGCPLAPLLYLFVAQALHSWLRASGVGVHVGAGGLLTASQYADDTKVLLRALEEHEVSSFLGVMDTFRLASGQRLNADKTELLPVGTCSTRPPIAVCGGLRVVDAARGVGITFTNKGGDRAVHTQRRGRRVVGLNVPPAHTAAIQAEVEAGRAAHHRDTGYATRHAVRIAMAASQSAATAAARAAVPQVQTPPPPTAAVESEVSASKMAERLRDIKIKFGTLSKLRLSIFGRGTASASYGLSIMMYLCEHVGMPPIGITLDLQQATNKLVDRGQAPNNRARAWTGVPAMLLPGRPREGGFGATPWVEHIRGRHAVAGARMLMSGAQPAQPCYRVAIEVLHLLHQYMSPLALCCPSLPADMGRLSPALAKLHEGLCCLPPVQDVVAAALSPGDWCYAAPLWGNPLLPAALMHANMAHARKLPCLGTVGDLVVRAASVRAVRVSSCFLGMSSAQWAAVMFVEAWLNEVLAHLPAGWVQAAISVHGRISSGAMQAPVLADALCVILPRLGWVMTWGDIKPRTIMLSHLSVREATQLQLRDACEAKKEAHARFIMEAHGQGAGGATVADHGKLLGVMSSCWDIAWENKEKEIFWRLAVNGVADGHQWNNGVGHTCGCGAANPRREHFFWSCPVAQAVVETLRQGCPGCDSLSKTNVWLMQAPTGVPHAIWLVVCLAALNGMNAGRKKMISVSRKFAQSADPEWRPHQAARTRFMAHGASHMSVAQKVEAAMGVAVSDFWGRLASFAALRRNPVGVGTSTPFLRVGAAGLQVNRVHA